MVFHDSSPSGMPPLRGPQHMQRRAHVEAQGCQQGITAHMQTSRRCARGLVSTATAIWSRPFVWRCPPAAGGVAAARHTSEVGQRRLPGSALRECMLLDSSRTRVRPVSGTPRMQWQARRPENSRGYSKHHLASGCHCGRTCALMDSHLGRSTEL